MSRDCPNTSSASPAGGTSSSGLGRILSHGRHSHMRIEAVIGVGVAIRRAFVAVVISRVIIIVIRVRHIV
jgi:hypothetical protein